MKWFTSGKHRRKLWTTRENCNSLNLTSWRRLSGDWIIPVATTVSSIFSVKMDITHARQYFAVGTYSVLQVVIALQRHTGYFLIQIYLPCTLLVILSWVGFWLNREATSDRVGLGKAKTYEIPLSPAFLLIGQACNNFPFPFTSISCFIYRHHHCADTLDDRPRKSDGFAKSPLCNRPWLVYHMQFRLLYCNPARIRWSPLFHEGERALYNRDDSEKPVQRSIFSQPQQIPIREA